MHDLKFQTEELHAAGLGTQELGWVTGFHVVLGVDERLALTSGVSVHFVQLFNIVVLGFLAHVAMRVRLVYLIRRVTTDRPGWIGPGRLATTIGMLAVIPAALALPALAALALVAALCWALIAWDVIHYREHRIEVRQARS